MTDAIRILLVDADMEHARELARDLERQSDPVDLVYARDAEAARSDPRSDGISAVVVGLPGGSEVSELLSHLQRRTPGLSVLALTEGVDDDLLAWAASHGASGVLPKPCGARSLLDLLYTPDPDGGFAGNCAGVSTAALMALHCRAGHDGVLHVWCPDEAGRLGSIHLEGGQPVHATAGARVGAAAVHDILGWRRARMAWLHGKTRCARTIVGRWEGLLAQSPAGPSEADESDLEQAVAVAYPDVIEKLSRLAQTPDVLGAFLLRRGEVVTGACVSDLDERAASAALRGLARVFYDVVNETEDPREIQSIVGGLRLVVDRLGPDQLGFQVGVVVRQAAPVCKSLRRLLRQIDRAFTKSIARAMPRRPRGGVEDSLHRVVA